MKYKRYFLTSESVTEGHPDKVADLISDAILDECLKQDKNSRVAVETLISKDKVIVAGQITSNATIDIEKIVREKLKEVGYTDSKINMDYKTCDVEINITKQSNDIAMGVDYGGAGDQGIMFGYATDESEDYMPYPISIANRLAKQLATVRKNGEIPYLKSDGKVQVTVEYVNDEPFRIDTILISTQHSENVDIVVKEGAIAAESSKEVAQRCKLLITMLPSTRRCSAKQLSHRSSTALWQITRCSLTSSPSFPFRTAISTALRCLSAGNPRSWASFLPLLLYRWLRKQALSLR